MNQFTSRNDQVILLSFFLRRALSASFQSAKTRLSAIFLPPQTSFRPQPLSARRAISIVSSLCAPGLRSLLRMCKRSNGLVVRAKKDRRDEEDIDVARFHSFFSRSRSLSPRLSFSLPLSKHRDNRVGWTRTRCIHSYSNSVEESRSR